MITSLEWLLAFNLEYNNLMSNKAAPLDEWEISVFLTKALESIVTALYNGGTGLGSFENNEQLRRALDALVTDKTIASSTSTNGNFGKVFDLSTDNVMFITYEQVTLTNDCNKSVILTVTPVTLDELHTLRKNPFKGANKRRVLRLDSGTDKVELVVSDDYTNKTYTYLVRFIRRPYPIILSNSATGFTSTDAIEGKLVSWGMSQTTPIDRVCELDESVHRLIVSLAVALAAAAYK